MGREVWWGVWAFAIPASIGFAFYLHSQSQPWDEALAHAGLILLGLTVVPFAVVLCKYGFVWRWWRAKREDGDSSSEPELAVLTFGLLCGGLGIAIVGFGLNRPLEGIGLGVSVAIVVGALPFVWIRQRRERADR